MNISVAAQISQLQFEPVFLNFVYTYFCVNENKDAKAHFAFVFIFNCSFCHFYITHIDMFRQSLLSNYLTLEYETLCSSSGRQSVLCK